MTTRRQFIAGSAAGLALGTGLIGPGTARAASTVTLEGLGRRSFASSMSKVMARSNRIVVPSYRFGVVMRSGVSATGSSGSVHVEAAADLVGVDLALLRRIADRACADFLSKLRSTGRDVLGPDAFTGTKGYGKFKTSAVPFLKKPFADARTVALVSPSSMPLINIHLDAPLSDQSPFELGNWKAINSISAELKALVMIPSVVIDFAKISGSGHKVYDSGASASIQPGLYVVPEFTQLNFFHAKIALAGEGGRMILKDRATIGQAGKLVQTGSTNNRAEIEEWNAYVRSMDWWNKPWAAGPMRPTQVYDYSTYQYRVDPKLFEQACFDGAQMLNAFYGGMAAENPAA